MTLRFAKSKNITNKEYIVFKVTLDEDYNRDVEVDFDLNHPNAIKMLSMLFCFMDEGILAGDAIDKIEEVALKAEGKNLDNEELSDFSAQILAVFNGVKEQEKNNLDLITPFVDPFTVIQ